MRDNHARNAKIIQFILRVNQWAFWYFVYPDTLGYLGFNIKVVKRAGVAVKRLVKREKTVMKSPAQKKGGAVCFVETLQRETVNNEMQKFKMSITGSYSNDATLRQIFEGVRIDKVQKGSLINSKNEWNYFRVARAIVAHDSASLWDKFSHAGLHDAGEHAIYFTVPNISCK